MPNENARALMASMFNKTFFVALREPLDLARMDALLEEHLHWAMEAEMNGHLFGSGPFVAAGQPPGAAGGMTIVRAHSLQEAQSVVAQDPFVREGAVRLSWRQWSLMEGSVRVTLRFSDQSLHLD